jgi:hypothetical protein
MQPPVDLGVHGTGIAVPDNDGLTNGEEYARTLAGKATNPLSADSDNDGLKDVGEPGIAGVSVTLLADTDGDSLLDDPIGAPVVTNTDGYYVFTNLHPGDHVVQATTPTGYSSSTGAAADTGT